MAHSFKETFSGFGSELLQGMRQGANTRLDDVAREEELIGVKNAIAALQKAGVEEEFNSL